MSSAVTDDELRWLGISALSDLLRRRELSPVELATATLDRIEDDDPEFHAFVRITQDRAIAEATDAEREIADGGWRGPLHGIPYAVKDLVDVAGEPTAAGCGLLADAVATDDATVVTRLREAGMVLVGKTHTVQFAFGGVGINHDTGTPRNPWPSSTAAPHVPGGSSSGSAVAVAAGLVPVAIGTDTSGSVRVPASLCGITGLKTTVGRVSRGGVYPLSPTLDSIGPLARSATDAALVYDAIQGRDVRDPSTAATHHEPIVNALARGVAGLRLGYLENVFFEDIDDEVRAAVRAAGNVLAELGAEIVSTAAPELDEVMGTPDAPMRPWTVAAEACVVNRRLLAESFDELDPVVSTRMLRGFDMSGVEFAEAQAAWVSLRAAFEERTAEFDAFLMPSTPIVARPVGRVDATPGSYAEHNVAYLRNTSIGNRLVWCGPSVPCGFTAGGLPIGLMIQATAMSEAVTMRIAHAFQQATDWHTRRP